MTASTTERLVVRDLRIAIPKLDPTATCNCLSGKRIPRRRKNYRQDPHGFICSQSFPLFTESTPVFEVRRFLAWETGMYLHGVHHARCRARMSVNRFPEPTSVGNGQIKITSQRVHCRQLAVADRAVRATANCSNTRQNRPLLRALTKHLLPKTNEGQNRSLDIHRVALFVSGIGVRNSPVTTRSTRLAITTMNTRRIRFAPSATDVDLAQTLSDHFRAASRGGGTLSLQFDSGDERESFKLPESAVDLLLEVFDGVASGRRIEVVSRNTELTIQQAADVLNVLGSLPCRPARVGCSAVSRSRDESSRSIRPCASNTRGRLLPRDGECSTNWLPTRKSWEWATEFRRMVSRHPTPRPFHLPDFVEIHVQQNPIRSVYLTSGRNRRLHFGACVVELQHAPRRQLSAPHRKVGDVIRALSWLGREEVEDASEAVIPTLSKVDLEELAAIHDIMPKWMAGPIRARLSHRFMFPSRDVDAPHESRSMESSMKDQLGCVAEAR